MKGECLIYQQGNKFIIQVESGEGEGVTERVAEITRLDIEQSFRGSNDSRMCDVGAEKGLLENQWDPFTRKGVRSKHIIYCKGCGCVGEVVFKLSR